MLEGSNPKDCNRKLSTAATPPDAQAPPSVLVSSGMSVQSAWTTDTTVNSTGVQTTAEAPPAAGDQVDIFIQVSNPEHGEEEERQQLTVSLSQLPEQLVADIRERLSVPAERTLRLRNADSSEMETHRSLAENGVKAGSVLRVDISPDDQTAAASEDLKQEEAAKEEAGAGAGPGEGERTAPSSLADDVQLLLSVRLLVDHLFRRSRHIWSRDSLGPLMASTIPARLLEFGDAGGGGPILFASPSLSPHHSPPPVHLSKSALFVDGGPIRLSPGGSLQDSLGAWLPVQDETADAFLQAASPRHTDAAAKVDLVDAAETQPEPSPPLTLTVSMATGRTCTWSTDRAEVTLTDVLRRLAAEMAPEGLAEEVALHCAGCGRRLSADEEEFQAIPAPCCRIRSLQLTDRRRTEDEELPKENEDTKDECTQTQTQLADAGMQCYRAECTEKSVQVLPMMLNKAVQTTQRSLRSRLVQVSTEISDIAVQTASCAVDAWTSMEDRLADRTDVLPLRLRIRPGRKDMWYCARQTDTLGHLITLLRRDRHLMGVADMRKGRRSLKSGANGVDWRSKKLAADCGLRAGDELLIDCINAPAVLTTVELPAKNSADVWTVPVSAGEGDWEAVRPKLEKLSSLPIAEAATVVCQWGAFYRRGGESEPLRRCVFCFDQAKGQSAGYRDEDDGRALECNAVSLWSHEFVRPGGGVRASPQLLPVLSVLLAPRLLHFDADAGGLAEVGPESLFRPEYVAVVFGLQVAETQPDGKWFAELSPGLSFCDSESGRCYNNAEAVVLAERSSFLSLEQSSLGHSSLPRSSPGQSSLGRSTLGHSSLGRSTLGHASLPRSSPGQSSLGRSTFGHSSSLGHSSLRRSSLEQSSLSDHSLSVDEEKEDEQGAWRRLLILLRDGDPVPQCHIPEGRFAYVRVRYPVEVGVEEDRLQCLDGHVSGEDSTWTMTPDIGDFQRGFTASMRR